LDPEIQLPLRREPERRVDPGERRVGSDTLGRSLLDARTRGFGKSIKKLDLAQRLGWIIPGPVFKVGAI
jgi:hypothetical protein